MPLAPCLEPEFLTLKMEVEGVVIPAKDKPEATEDDAFYDPVVAAVLASQAGTYSEPTSMSPLDAVLKMGRVPMTVEQIRVMYGDDDSGLDSSGIEKRIEQEQHWMCPRPQDPQTRSVHGGAFLAPERTVVLGTNGTRCFALQCTSDDSRNDKELRPKSKETAEQDIMEYYATYGAHNSAVAYKLELLAEERAAFMRNQKYHIRSIKTDEEGKRLLQDMQKYATMDVMLRDPLRKLATRYPKYRKQPVETRFEERPEGASKVTRQVDLVFEENKLLSADSSSGIGEIWRLFMYDVERMTSWKDVDIMMRTEPGTAPCAAFSSTQLVLLWVTPNSKGQLCLQTFGLLDASISRGNGKPKHTSTRFFSMPEVLTDAPGLMTMHLNELTGWLCLAKGNGVMLVPPASEADAGIHVYTLDSRIITTAQTRGNQETLMLCTNEGECILTNLKEPGAPSTLVLTPCAEPIYGALWMDNGALVLHSIMGLTCVLDGGTGAIVVVPLVRPTCVAACGAILYVGNKSGIIVARRPLVLEERARYYDPPQQTHMNVPLPPLLQQHVWLGMHASRTRVVYVNQAGVVQVLQLEEQPSK